MGSGPLPEPGGRKLRPAALITALDWEAKCVPRGPLAPFIVETSGMGQQAAAAAARRVVEQRPALLVSFGSAGALDPGLSAGAVLLPERIVDDAGSLLEVDQLLHRSLHHRLAAHRPVTGNFLSINRPLIDRAAKERWWLNSGAVAVDMESIAIARVAEKFGLPFLALRVVIDRQDEEIPEALLQACDRCGRIPVRHVLSLLYQRQIAGRTLARLAFARWRAARRLKRLADELVRGLTQELAAVLRSN